MNSIKRLALHDSDGEKTPNEEKKKTRGLPFIVAEFLGRDQRLKIPRRYDINLMYPLNASECCEGQCGREVVYQETIFSYME